MRTTRIPDDVICAIAQRVWPANRIDRDAFPGSADRALIERIIGAALAYSNGIGDTNDGSDINAGVGLFNDQLMVRRANGAMANEPQAAS